MKPKTFRLRRESCDCETPCNCKPDLTLLVNGHMGHGAASWVLDTRTKVEGYQCEFFGWTFMASSRFDAARKLEARLNAFRDEETTVDTF